MDSFDRSDIRRTFQLFHQTGDIREGRILNAGKFRTISGYFDDAGVMTDAVVGFADEPFPAYYFTLNPVRRDLFARSANKFTKYAKETTADADIIERRWLPIDLDPIRPAGISSNEEEHAAALQKAIDIREWLISKGWQAGAFILADSGNGGHLAVKINLPNDEASRDLVKRCLEALDSTFSNDKVKVDTTTYNAARIWKIYGTTARKGSDTNDRPHRLAKILDAPNELSTVLREQIEDLAATKAAPKGQHAEKSHTDFDPRQYAEAHGATVAKVKSGWVDPKGKRWTLAILEECPFNADHNRAEAWVGVADNGERGFGCPHDGCKGNDWHVLRNLWEGPRPAPKELWDATPEEAEALLAAVMEERGMAPMSEEEFNAFKLDSGPKLTCNLPGDNFISRFMQYGSEISDAYHDYWFAGAIFVLAVATDKKLKFELGQDTIYTNVYIYIAGGSTLARKTTALKKSVRILEESVGGRLGISKVPNEFSPEAFIEHMDQFNHAPWIRDEAAGVLSLMRKDYMRGFKDTLMQLYDCTPITRMLRTSQRKAEKTSFNIADPFLNVFFASTDAALGANTEANDALSGFLARFMFFYPQGEKDCYMPLRKGTARHSELEEIARGQLRGIVELMDSIPDCVDMNYTPDAQAYYEEWQERREKELARLKDGFSSQIFGRLMPAVVKLAILFEVGSPGFDPSKPIGLASFQEACRLADEYFLPMSRAVYDLVGQTEEKNVIDKIVAYLKRNGGRATQRETARAIKIKSKELAEYLSTMLEYGMIDRREKDNGGKGRNQVYLFLREAGGSNVPKVHNVTNVTNVPDKDCVMDSQGTLVTLEPLVTKETLEPIKRESNPEIDRIRAGHQKHVARRRTCCLCGRSFPYDLTPYFNKGQSGYICVTCHMEGPPAEPVKADSQTKLEASG